MARSLAKDASYSVIAVGVGFAANLLASIVVARELGPIALGIYSLLVWFRAMASSVVDLGLSNAVARYWPELVGRGDSDLAKIVAGRLFITQLGVIFLAWFLIIQGKNSIASLFKKPDIVEYLPLVAATFALTGTATFLRALISGTQQFRAKMLVDIATSLTLLASLALLTISKRLGITELLSVELIIGILQIMLLFCFLRGSLSIRRGFQTLPDTGLQLISYCAGAFVFTSLYALLMQKVETFFITRFHDVEQIAYFNMSYNIAMSLLVLLPAALSTVVLSALARSFGANDRPAMTRTFYHSTRFVAFLILPIGIGGAAIAPTLVVAIYGPAYAPAGDVLSILFVSAVFSSIVTMIIPMFWALGESIPATLWLLPNAVITVGLAYLIIPQGGAIGAAYSNLLTQILLCASGLIYLRYRRGFIFPAIAFMRIGGAALLAAILAYLNILLFGPAVGLFSGLLMAIASYVPSLLLLRAVTVDDLNVVDHIWDSLPREVSRLLKCATYRIRTYAVAATSEISS